MKKINNKGVADATLITIASMVFLAILFIFGCTENTSNLKNEQSAASSSDITQNSPHNNHNVVPRIALYWENTVEKHDERKPWSDFLINKISENFSSLDKAQDIEYFCPKYRSLDKNSKLKAWGELFVALAYYESGFKPSSQSVDVGTKEKRDTWSIGLFQMSVVDIENYKIQNMKYSFDDLLRPEPNIDLAVTIMAQQINKKSLIVVKSNPYWATLYNGKYPKIKEIAVRVKKYAPLCN